MISHIVSTHNTIIGPEFEAVGLTKAIEDLVLAGKISDLTGLLSSNKFCCKRAKWIQEGEFIFLQSFDRVALLPV